MRLTEDSIYRGSTQFRSWSFTATQLTDQRRKTNIQASERIRAAVVRHRTQGDNKVDTASSSGNEPKGGSSSTHRSITPVPALEPEVDCLTVAEEKKLVDLCCETALELGNFLKFPIDVTATGIRYLRRFYLSSSPMTYDLRIISQSTMFMANKIEMHFLSAEEFSARLVNTTVETILASEYLILQSLRFNLEVKHPFRGLKGGNLELMAMAHGNAAPIAGCDQTPAEMQRAMLTLPLTPSGPAASMSVPELEKRIEDAYVFAAHILKTTALLTDAYFHYTPPQISLSAHLLADEPLTLFYLSTKNSAFSSIYPKILTTLRSCAALLASHWSFTAKGTSKEETQALEKKKAEEFKALVKRNKRLMGQHKIELVKLNQAKKRDPLDANGELEGSKAKKRKLEREEHQKESDNFWGPELPKNGTKGVK